MFKFIVVVEWVSILIVCREWGEKKLFLERNFVYSSCGEGVLSIHVLWWRGQCICLPRGWWVNISPGPPPPTFNGTTLTDITLICEHTHLGLIFLSIRHINYHLFSVIYASFAYWENCLYISFFSCSTSPPSSPQWAHIFVWHKCEAEL